MAHEPSQKWLMSQKRLNSIDI